MRIGILTGGGDAPGLNAVIRAAVRKSLSLGWEVLGYRDGWRGVIEDRYDELTIDSVSGILPRGGTILGTSRTNPFKKEGLPERIVSNLKKRKVATLIAIGGEDTLGVAAKLSKLGVKVVGVPKTIDNDLLGTDATFGFDTAINIATEAIDRLHSTAESHQRVMVVEVMGRDAGWIALYSGIAGGADVILVPEEPFDIRNVIAVLEARAKRGKSFSIIVAAEGAKPKGGLAVTQTNKVDEFGHARLGGVGQWVADQIEHHTDFETRVTILGHVQRGGTPTAFDRVLGSRFGIAAVELIEEKKFGYMVSLQGVKVLPVPIARVLKGLRTLPPSFYQKAKVFFG